MRVSENGIPRRMACGSRRSHSKGKAGGTFPSMQDRQIVIEIELELSTDDGGRDERKNE